MKEGDTEILMLCANFESSDEFLPFNKTGWSWRHVRVWPATLNRLESEGYLTTVFKGEAYHGYRISDSTKQLLNLSNSETPLQIAHRIEIETGMWLKEHGYNPSVAHIYLEAIHLQNKVVATDFMKELLLMRPHSPDTGAKE